MNYMKKILFFSLTISLISTLFIRPQVPVNIKAADAKIKTLSARIRTYIKCLRSTCTPQERQSAETTIHQDTVAAIGLLATLTTIGYLGIAKYKKTWPFLTPEEKKPKKEKQQIKRLQTSGNEEKPKLSQEIRKKQLELQKMEDEERKNNQENLDNFYKKYENYASHPDKSIAKSTVINWINLNETLGVIDSNTAMKLRLQWK